MFDANLFFHAKIRATNNELFILSGIHEEFCTLKFPCVVQIQQEQINPTSLIIFQASKMIQSIFMLSLLPVAIFGAAIGDEIASTNPLGPYKISDVTVVSKNII